MNTNELETLEVYENAIKKLQGELTDIKVKAIKKKLESLIGKYRMTYQVQGRGLKIYTIYKMVYIFLEQDGWRRVVETNEIKIYENGFSFFTVCKTDMQISRYDSVTNLSEFINSDSWNIPSLPDNLSEFIEKGRNVELYKEDLLFLRNNFNVETER